MKSPSDGLSWRGKQRGLSMNVISAVEARIQQSMHEQNLDVPRKQGDEVCDVCREGYSVEGNAIVLCDGEGCNVAVHQLCYGVDQLPDGEWLCDVCSYEAAKA